MKRTILTVLIGICFSETCVAHDDASAGGLVSEVHVGVYSDVGAGASANNLMRVLRDIPGVYVRPVTAAEIRNGVLGQLDALIHPGGSGGKQGRQLGEAGRKVVQQYVADGGGYIGICAGAYLASADYSWSLDLLNAKVLDRQHWARGTGIVDVRFTEDGKRFFRASDSSVRIFYGQGPLLARANRSELPDYTVLATYDSEIAKNGAPSGVMPGTTAIARSMYGKGHVVCFSPHPELTDGLDSMVRQALVHVVHRRHRPVSSWPAQHLTNADLTPDISQKGLPNTEYCAPCAVANVLFQFAERDKLELPQEFGTLPGDSSEQMQRSLAELLGDDDHMKTKSRKGTNRYRLVNGLFGFLREHDCPAPSVSYLGLRLYDRTRLEEDVRSCVISQIGVPRLPHLKRELNQGNGVLILFGSYKPNPDMSDRLERVGGHYVAAVGYGQAADGSVSPESVILHDSNDALMGHKYVQGRVVSSVTELWADGAVLARSDRLVELVNAPIRQDGRIAFLETIFAIQPTKVRQVDQQSAESGRPTKN